MSDGPDRGWDEAPPAQPEASVPVAERALVKNSADPEQVKKGKAKHQRQAARAADDLRVVLQSGAGARFVWRLLSQCGVHESAFDVIESHPRMSYREGKKDIGRYLIAELAHADPLAYARLQTETSQDPNL